MSEQQLEKIETWPLRRLKVGDILHVIASQDDETYLYDFLVEEPGLWPLGILAETKPDGTILGPEPAYIHGCGHWTDRRQNPVQKQEKAFTPAFGCVALGSQIIIADPANDKRHILNATTTEITITRA